MSHEQDFDDNIIVRFLMKEASEEDVAQLHLRLDSDEEFKNHFEQIRDTWNRIELEKDLNEVKIQRDLEKVLSRTEDKSKSKIRSIISANHWLFKAAAIFILGFGISWMLFHFQGRIADADIIYNTIETPRGSKSIVSLPDGSQIILNAQSKLRYPERFTGKERKVFLEGEAFFDVAKDQKKQFIVNTPDLMVKVFGTSFNIKSYPDENTVETTLVEGSISLFKTSPEGKIASKEIKMEPNQQVVLYKETGSNTSSKAEEEEKQEMPKPVQPRLMLAKKIDTERYVSWKDGQLKIKSEPLEKLAVTLERRYDVSIHFESDEIKDYRFTGVIKNETIEQVMSAIKLASSIDYKIDEREIWIRDNKRN